LTKLVNAGLDWYNLTLNGHPSSIGRAGAS
jgi:hypothetical protein